MIWLHIISDLKKINFDSLQLSEEKIKLFISNSIKQVWLTELWSYYHTFWKHDEITWIIALAESHVSFHAWPEKDYISLDIFVCNTTSNNSDKAKKLYNMFIEFLDAKNIKDNFIERKS